MPIMDDPEIIEDFINESNSLFDNLETILEDLEDNPENPEKLEEFGQVIDRIMGAAKSIQADQIALFCELGKIIGYKSSQVKDIPLINIVVAILFDSIDLLRKMCESLKADGNTELKSLSTEAFGTRLHWLSEKFKHIDRASVSFKEKNKDENKEGKNESSENKTSDKMDQSSIDDLMAELGL